MVETSYSGLDTTSFYHRAVSRKSRAALIIYLNSREINRRMVLMYGGFYTEGDDNLANPGSLAYILDAIQGSFFGHDLYSILMEKAAALAWQIIRGHIFHDGNKRAGMEACRLMLDLNGYTMKIDHKVIDIALQISEKQIAFQDFVQWIAARVVKKPLEDRCDDG
jgi:death-on-curing family protein